uniref:Late blight resistance protein n=1 Tax=Solanum tuberosum TaxID=4113 RepID=M1DB71_SOLTU
MKSNACGSPGIFQITSESKGLRVKKRRRREEEEKKKRKRRSSKLPSRKSSGVIPIEVFFQLAYSYIQCTDASWPASYDDADTGTPDQHPVRR